MDWKMSNNGSLKNEIECETSSDENEHEMDFEDELMPLESIVIKEEPREMNIENDSAAFNPSVVVKTEINFDDDEFSSDDDLPLKRDSPLKRKCTKKVENYTIECKLCDYKTDVKNNYWQHIIRNHKAKSSVNPEEAIIKCPLCDYKSNVKNNYRRHVQRSHKHQELQCDGCDKSCHLIYQLLKHRELEHGLTNEYRVDVAQFIPKAKTAKVKIKDQAKTKPTPKPEEVICPLCNYKTKIIPHYRTHVYRKHRGHDLNCDGCDKTFNLVYNLSEHRETEHGFTHEYKVERQPTPTPKVKEDLKKEGEEIICPLCEYKTNVKQNYERHVVRIHKRQELPCEECDFKHHLVYILEKHRREKHSLENVEQEITTEEPPPIVKLVPKKGEIKCPLCDYNTDVKPNYQQHVYRTHKNQQLQCDGCDKSYNLIYNLEEHRKSEHGFTHEYGAVPTKETKSEKEISCPLCDYKNNHKESYQKHVVRVHKRQELQCEECDFKHHLIYILENHRRVDHNLDTKFEVDESLKLATFYQKLRYTIGVKDSTEDGKPAKIYECPLCSYKNNNHSSFYYHYKSVHKNIELPCDGCSGKFHIYYGLLQHRKQIHDFDHPYEVPESVKLQISKKKEQRRIEKGQNFPCPKCDKWFAERRNVYMHVRVVHNFYDYELPVLDPMYKQICSFCGKLYEKYALETHIRKMHPEQREPYICHYCDNPSKTKYQLRRHMSEEHNFAIKYSNSCGGRAPRDHSKFKTPKVKTPYKTTRKEYCCSYCPEIFQVLVTKKRHEASVHTFNWPYSCFLCDKKFVLESDLNKHLKRHREGKRLNNIKCENCEETFLRTKLFKTHKCSKSTESVNLSDYGLLM